ncbi:MAG: NAD(P)/FAD-dependent oxidoreductase [Gammaproteobacteria bacterium]|jgi:monoamine oxidase|nr:NAD(P)/FAD-dependent oxidoreductase [Gammaproteobacteria bacterium]
MQYDKGKRRTLKNLAAAGAIASLPAVLAGCAAPTRKDADVIVIGAGLSGLNAAILLQDQGFDVQVLEGSARVGGRVFTLDDQPHKPEAGGSEFSLVSYARILDMINRLELEVVPWRGTDVRFAYFVNGELVAGEDWPASPANKVSVAAARPVPPMFISTRFIPQPVPLSTMSAWLEPEGQAYDVPLGDYLQANGADAEALRLIASRNNTPRLNDMSALWRMRADKFAEAFGGLDQLRNLGGGMSRLPEAMAAVLKRGVQLKTPVTAVTTSDTGVQVTTADGSTYSAAFAVCTVPLPMLRQIDLQPALADVQAKAVAEIPYDDHMEVYFDVLEPYWEIDGLASSLWTDSELGLVLHIADPGSLGYLWLAISGTGSQALLNLPEAEVFERLTAALIAARPSLEGRIKPMTTQNWSKYPWNQGHVAYRAPGQITEFGAVLTQPHGRIHFAGEHTAVLNSGMEGAMESGERAAIEIITRSG